MSIVKMHASEKNDTMDDDKAGDFETGSVEQVTGQERQMRQQFSVWSLGSLCLCLMATWEALSTVVATALTSGGAPCLFYNYIISFLCSVAVAASLAEIASMYPTAGGQYHWVSLLAPQRSGLVASWFTGWISCGGQIVLTASAAFSAGLQFQALIVVNNPDTYVPQRWQGMLFYWLVLLYGMALNIWGNRILPHVNIVSGVIHIVGLIAIVIVLAVMSPKNTAEFVFTEVTNDSGWESGAIAWMVGMLSTVYPFLGYDSATHLAEEMKTPARDVPVAMVGSVVFNSITGLGYCVILLYSISGLDDLLQSPTGFPTIQLFLNVTGSRVGTTLLALTWALIAVAATMAGITSTSRTAWAFARDDAIFFSGYFSHIDEKLDIPLRMVVAVTFLQVLLGFLYLGSSTAFNAVLAMAITGMYMSYLLPIIYMLLNGRKSGTHRPGPFRLGRITGPVTNAVSIAWLLFAMLFSMFPNYQPVTAENMNYCIVVMGGWCLLGAFYYFGWGKKKYSGPAIEVLHMVE